jgi:hypothetical protein
MLLGMVCVVAGDDRGVEHLFQGVPARLTGFELQEIEHLALAVEQEIVEAEKDAGPSPKAQLRPLPLGNPGTVNGDSDVGGGAPWDEPEHLASEWGVYRNGVLSGATGRALTGQPT